MIKSVKVTNYLNQSMTLELRHPEKSGLFIFNITGLGPPEANINISEMSTGDGGTYNSSRLTPRNIVMTLGFTHSPTVEAARMRTYKYFPIQKKVKLTITTDTRVAEIIGYVESNEPFIFSQESYAQISIMCPDPYFYSTKITKTVFSGIEAMFEFPFSNESLTEPLLEFGKIRVDQEQTVLYSGDAEVGVQIHIHAVGSATGLVIHNINTREKMAIDDTKLIKIIGSGISYGDDIVITTTRYSKAITLFREGVHYNILNSLDRDTDWFKLMHGDNIFVYTAETGSANLQFRISNQIAYEGV